MEIVKKGKPRKERVWSGTCNECGSVLRAKESELVINYDQREGPFGEAKCPVCEHPRVIFYPQEK